MKTRHDSLYLNAGSYKNQNVMKKIGTYINELLFWHDCVIIPGLGGFVANHLSAEIDDEKGLFLPPRKEIGFNRSLSHNDGLLINYVAVHEGVEYQAAALQVKQYVDEVLRQINSGFSFDIDSVGVLKSDAIGNLLFQPFNTSGFLADSFGLSSFHFDAGVAEEERQSASVRRVLRPVSLRHVAASVAVMAGLFLFSPEINIASGSRGLNQAGYLSVLLPQAGQSASETSVLASEEETAIPVEEPMQSVATEVEEVAPRYYIIAGSFPVENQADAFIEQLNRKGVSGGSKLHCKGKIRVAIEGFANKADAVERMKAYKLKQGFEGVWVYAHNK